MNKLNLALSIAPFLLIGAFGCKTADTVERPQAEKMTQQEQEGAREVADKYMSDFVAAFQDDDFAKFKSLLPPDKQNQITPEQFQKIRETTLDESGNLVSVTYVTTLRKVVYQAFVWKLSYEKKDSKGELQHRDLLYYVLVGKTGDNQYTVGSAGFCL